MLSSLMFFLYFLIYYDYQQVQKSSAFLKSNLKQIRMETLVNGVTLLVAFDKNKMSVLSYPEKQMVKTIKIPLLENVQYDTKVGPDTIVFNKGTTSAFNTRIHGGEITLKSWFGFKKHIHVNCAGYIREGRYPED